MSIHYGLENADEATKAAAARRRPDNQNSAEAISNPAPPALFELTPILQRIVVMMTAITMLGIGVAVIGYLAGLSNTTGVAAKSPFNTGLREAAPLANGIGNLLLALQSRFSLELVSTLRAVKTDGMAFWSLLGLGFAYGIFHAMGPGHGKGVISGYIIASRRTLTRGLALSAAAGILQALVAICLVGILAWLLHVKARQMNAVADGVEIISFVLVACFGVLLTWRKTAAFVKSPRRATASSLLCEAVEGDAAACSYCGGSHILSAERVQRLDTWRESLGVIAAAGTRPCSGAIILLVFAASQNLFAAGIAATFAMSLGVAVTTGAVASLAVVGKKTTLRLVEMRPDHTGQMVKVLELLAAAFVVVLGLALAIGLWLSGSGPS